MQIGNYDFEGPYLLEDYPSIDRAAVYAILCKNNSNRYYVIYIGETGQLGTRLPTHHKKECWHRHCQNDLYVAIFWTPSSDYSPEDRRRIEEELINIYEPVCNDG